MTRPPTSTVDGKGGAIPRKVKGYEEGFEYGETCARRMSRERRMDNAAFVRGSEYFQPHSVTRDYWRGFVSAMETTTF